MNNATVEKAIELVEQGFVMDGKFIYFSSTTRISMPAKNVIISNCSIFSYSDVILSPLLKHIVYFRRFI